MTPKANFIVLLGDRYGWRPLPFAILADEFEDSRLYIRTDPLHHLRQRLNACQPCPDDPFAAKLRVFRRLSGRLPLLEARQYNATQTRRSLHAGHRNG